MCWWTMRKDSILKNDFWRSCTYKAYGFNGTKYYSPTRSYQDPNFSCAMFSFCPGNANIKYTYALIYK